jgi:ATP-dependent DNA helicase RecG
MRPEILYPFFAETLSLPGVGGRTAANLEKIIGGRILDIFWHLPFDIIDRRKCPRLIDIDHEQIATVKVTIDRHDIPPHRSRAPYKVWCSDETGTICLTFFHARSDYLLKELPEGKVRLISGKIEVFKNALQMNHPDYIVPLARKDEIPMIQPVYPLTAGISAKVMGKITRGALGKARKLPEWIDKNLLKHEGWPDWYSALQAVHEPKSQSDVMASSLNRRRLAYDEFLASQLAMEIMRLQMRKKKGRSFKPKGALKAQILKGLPYELTGAQKRTLKEIEGDMAEDFAMMRLLQGDVGSGKTVVALLAMLNAVETGAQAAIIAPTEILARQHLQSLTEMCSNIPINIEILTGRNKGKKREAILERLAAGEIDILIGTHALFQKDVIYKDLGMAVIDEQHRFGVEQRMALAAKANNMAMDIVAMTATPIPRTLTLTIYGDMDVSKLDEKPAGRKSVDTRTLPLQRLDEIVEGCRRALDKGTQIYWVCPLVEESEKLDLAAASARFKHLEQIFGEKVGLVHGKMKAKDKDDVMEKFTSGEVSLLIATTVIEVGVNVPNATIMVIEHAERFGLSQLHQLRGRVGRGDEQSVCLLLYGHLGNENAKARLKIMRETDDGFLIAEKDLKLRGAGELLGVRQSGIPDFKVASIEDHGDLIRVARDDARLILNKDPALSSERGKALKMLLYLFERDEGVKYLKSG